MGSGVEASSLGKLIEESELTAADHGPPLLLRLPSWQDPPDVGSIRLLRRGAEGRSHHPGIHTSMVTPSRGHRISSAKHDLAVAPGGPGDIGEDVDTDFGTGVRCIDHGAVPDVDADVIGDAVT